MSQRDRPLLPCAGCQRHVTSDEASCPFCAAPMPGYPSEPPRALTPGRLGRAALVVAVGASATLIGACSNPTPMPPYGSPPIFDAGSISDSRDGAAGGSGAADASGTGGDAGGDAADGIRRDAGSVVPAYGAPATGHGG